MDELDAAFENEDIARRAAIESTSAAGRALIGTSAVCLECGGLTVAGARWCNVDCRDTWQLRQR